MNHVFQIPENFPVKLKDILTYLFKTEKQIIEQLYKTNLIQKLIDIETIN